MPAVDACSVRVAVRVRPLVAREKVDRCAECMTVLDGHGEGGGGGGGHSPQVVVGKERQFAYDYVFGTFATQREIYVACVEPLVCSWFEGYNATVFAYGQTGSGKTFTMGSCSNMHVYEEEQGIITRVATEVFERMESATFIEDLARPRPA